MTQRSLLLKKFKDGIYYSAYPDSSLPVSVTIAGKFYSRFMDFIYLPSDPEFLSAEQVVAVAELRRRYLDSLEGKSVNTKVKDIFLQLIQRTSPRSLLEIGPSFHSLFGATPKGIDYWVADLSREAVLAANAKGIKGFVFDLEGSASVEHVPRFDMAIAIFVMHFQFSSAQISTLTGFLADDGLLVANVYRRSQESRDKLRRLFADLGFECLVWRDSLSLHKGHEYWCLYKASPESVILSRTISFLSDFLQ